MAVGQIEMALEARAPDFKLPATDGRVYALKDVSGAKGTVIVFICNHCPYVKAVIGRLTADARLLMAEGVGFAAISSNDAASYPEDSFPKMDEFARGTRFPVSLPARRDASCRARLWRRLHARLLRLRPGLEAPLSRPPGRGPDDPAAAQRPPRASRSHARHRRREARAGEPGPVDRLLDQVEGGAVNSPNQGVMAGTSPAMSGEG